jgi:carbonic anhydrase
MKSEAAADPDAFAPTVVSKRAWLSRKTVIIAAASVLAMSGVGAATWVLWPKPTEPASDAKSAKAKKAKSAGKAASAVEEAQPAEETAHAAAAAPPPPAASAPQRDGAAAVGTAAPPAPAGSAAPAPKAQAAQTVVNAAPSARPTQEVEDPMDRLRRRIGETLGGARLETGTPGELRVVSRGTAAAHAKPVAARRDDTSRGSAPSAAAAKQGKTAAHSGNWDYDGVDGPDRWAQLNPSFATCASGTRQSPIDIRDGVKVELEPPQFNYQPSAFRVIDNGHTVQVNVAAGNWMTVQGRQFELQQFHFHRPSEEHVNGRQYDMVAHLVHKDAEGRLAVLAVLLDRGAAQPIVQAVWNNLPLEKNEELAATLALDLNRLLPEDRRYYTYMGSLTTPPCNEGVLWMVLKHPMPVSPEQIAIFARLYPMNARPLQAGNGRLIKESN